MHRNTALNSRNFRKNFAGLFTFSVWESGGIVALIKSFASVEKTKLLWLTAALCLFVLITWPPSRAFAFKHPGLIGVLVAVTGEVYFDWKEEKGKHARWKKFFMGLLIVSLAYELYEASETDKEAAEAIKLAQQAKEQSEKEALARAKMEKEVVQLKLKLQPRIITSTQVTNFIFLTERIPKVPIKIIVPVGGAVSFAGQLRHMLTCAGFGMDSSVNSSGGVTFYPASYPTRPPGESFEWSSIVFVHYGTNARPLLRVAPISYYSQPTNGFQRPITFNMNDQNEILYDLDIAFREIEITSVHIESDYWVKENEIGILIPAKND
jgi:hypothetical protein